MVQYALLAAREPRMKDGASKAPLGKCTEGGWEDFTRKIKESLSRPLTPEEIHMIMQKHYIKGHTPEKALEDLNNG